MPPKGGGEVIFACPVKKVLKPIQYIDPGKIKRIRGMAYPSLTVSEENSRLLFSFKDLVFSSISA